MARPDLIARGGRPRAARHGWIAFGLACLLGTAQAGCVDAVAADAGALHSRWDEIGAQGQRLVRERGTLAAAAIELDTHCLPGRWALRLGHAQGERAYAGQSTTGTPIRSTSHLRQDRLQLQWRLPWRAGFALEARAGAEQLRREIDSVGRIAGYPERFRHLHAAIGLRHDATPAPGLRLALAGWLGGGLALAGGPGLPVAALRRRPGTRHHAPGRAGGRRHPARDAHRGLHRGAAAGLPFRLTRATGPRRAAPCPESTRVLPRFPRR